MKTGIIVYSQTGNTIMVAKKIEEKIKIVDLEQITVENINTPNLKLVNTPEVNNYDRIIFAAPVQAFSLCNPMKLYLKQISSLKDKKILCFVTQQLSKPWLGGNHAIKQMKKLCHKKDGIVLDTVVINWSNKEREKQIEKLVDKFSTK